MREGSQVAFSLETGHADDYILVIFLLGLVLTVVSIACVLSFTDSHPLL